MIRSGICKFTDEVGRLWTSLADYYIRRGLYEKARDIFEEGISTVITVRDFSVIFEAYAQFEQSALAAKLEAAEDDPDNEMDGKGGGKDGMERVAKKFLDGCWLNDDNDADLRLAHFERLFDRRPELLNSVLLRQNPHNVEQWHRCGFSYNVSRRVKLFEGGPTYQASTYVEAVKTVDPAKAVGKPHTLWVAFAKMYEEHNQLDSVEQIFKKATQVNYKTVDHLASVWCEWAEMELRRKNIRKAIELMRQATAEPSVEVKRRAAAEGNEPVQMKLHKSLRLWSFYIDLEESLGSLESTRVVYERILDLRIATPKIILNYAFLLAENKYFEDAFKVYERGVKIFKYPHVRDIWVTYLSEFVKRYGKSKLDRARELFEEAIEQTPVQEVKPLFLQYAKLEEDYGLAERVMNVYDRAVKTVSDSEKLSMYEIYIARAVEMYGVPKTREIYEQAIKSGLPPNAVKSMCLKNAELERNLGEIDRARAIFVFLSNYADPRSDPDFWSKWKDFEIRHGNKETFREMLRNSRSFSAGCSKTHFILQEYLMQKDQKLSVKEAVGALKRAGVPKDEMGALEQQLAGDSSANSSTIKDSSARAVSFVHRGVVEPEPDTTKRLVANAEEIDLPESDSDEEGIEIAQKSVPAAVFGELANKAADKKEREDDVAGHNENRLGALERIKRQRQQ
ncbi:hypothetical protein LUZ61_011872 [Rhynchospora tenuis]|uniref:Pre-mRNA-splicing factor SYF1 n=1 Tax=Rhynchospora tenuis TaxID=198213 RepID=A0AAD6A1X1_9POAL|nr:hypothetical protein LUZ61_011872 [Rhynchospora tenuis]